MFITSAFPFNTSVGKRGGVWMRQSTRKIVVSEGFETCNLEGLAYPKWQVKLRDEPQLNNGPKLHDAARKFEVFFGDKISGFTSLYLTRLSGMASNNKHEYFGQSHLFRQTLGGANARVARRRRRRRRRRRKTRRTLRENYYSRKAFLMNILTSLFRHPFHQPLFAGFCAYLL